MKTIIHVNRHHIAKNAKDGGDRPVFTLKYKGKTTYAREVYIKGPSKMVYDTKGLSCGAKAYIITESPVIMTDPMSFTEATQALDEAS